MSELKPCPFCGGSALLRGFAVDEAMHWWVACENCGATSGELLAESTPDRDFAVESWNHRTHPQPVTPAGGEVDALRKTVELLKLRIHFIGWPAEGHWNAGTDEAPHWVPDWRFEIACIENVLNGAPMPERKVDSVPYNLITHPAVADAALAALSADWRSRADDLEPVEDAVGLTHQLKLRDCADELDAALNQRGGG